MSSPDDVTYFTKLGADECRDLLASRRVGRVAWQTERGIDVLPVNFAIDGEVIAFHTFEGSALERLLEPTEVSFQADDIDEESAIGWSVLAHGTSGPLRSASETESWAPGADVGIAISITRIGGRVVSGHITK